MSTPSGRVGSVEVVRMDTRASVIADGTTAVRKSVTTAIKTMASIDALKWAIGATDMSGATIGAMVVG